MKILILIDSLRRGGRERRMIELLKSFRKHEYIHVELVVFSNVIEYPEIHNLPYPIHLIPRIVKKDPTVFYKFYRSARRIKPSIVHSWGTMSTIYAIPTCKIMGLVLINGNIADAPQNLNLLDPRFLRAKLTFGLSDLVVGNSEAGLRAYKAPESKSHCIYNGFDPTRFRDLENPMAVKKRMQILGGPVIGMVGAFYDRKDYETFIVTAIRMVRDLRNINFIAVGNGPNLETIKGMVPESLKDRIILPGLIQDIESVINIFDIGVLSTNQQVHGEGISNAILEYMALGKPTIATDGGGTPEIVQDEVTGFLIPGKDIQSLVDKISLLIEDANLRRQMGENARDLALKKFTIEVMEQKYLKLYQSCLSSHSIDSDASSFS